MDSMDPSEIPQVDFFRKKGDDLDFEIMELESFYERSAQLRPKIEQPHRLSFHNILFITQGSAHHHIDFTPYPVRSGSLVFIARGQVHSFEVRPKIRGYMVLFTQKYLEENLIHSDVISYYRLYNYHLHSPILSPSETEEENIGSLFAEIFTEYRRPEPLGKKEILRLLVKLLLYKTERIKQNNRSGEKNADWLVRFGQFREQLERYFTTTRSVKDYARLLKISPKHLNTICRSVSGTTAKRCVDNFTILEIKRDLATSDSSVQEISYRFGFDEPTNFVKYYKKHTGQSPAQFRKTLTG